MGDINMTAAIFCKHDTLSRPLLQNRFMKINPDGIQNRENCSLNNQGIITQKICKQELSFLYATYRHDLFYITEKCHDNLLKGI